MKNLVLDYGSMMCSEEKEEKKEEQKKEGKFKAFLSLREEQKPLSKSTNKIFSHGNLHLQTSGKLSEGTQQLRTANLLNPLSPKGESKELLTPSHSQKSIRNSFFSAYMQQIQEKDEKEEKEEESPEEENSQISNQDLYKIMVGSEDDLKMPLLQSFELIKQQTN